MDCECRNFAASLARSLTFQNACNYDAPISGVGVVVQHDTRVIVRLTLLCNGKGAVKQQPSCEGKSG